MVLRCICPKLKSADVHVVRSNAVGAPPEKWRAGVRQALFPLIFIDVKDLRHSPEGALRIIVPADVGENQVPSRSHIVEVDAGAAHRSDLGSIILEIDGEKTSNSIFGECFDDGTGRGKSRLRA